MTISMKDSIIKLSKVSKFFGKSGASQPVLCNINLEIFSSNMVAIKGKSGCGKSTLLNIIAATLFAVQGKCYIRERIFNFFQIKSAPNIEVLSSVIYPKIYIFLKIEMFFIISPFRYNI